jgi:hypothetical protein
MHMNARFAALAALALVTGCQSFSAPDSVVYGAAVATHYRSGTVWSSYTNVAVDPNIVVVDGTGTVQTSCKVSGATLATFIENELTARGYTPVTFDSVNPGATNADLVVKMTAHLGSQAYYYGGGYCGWYPYYYCYPGWSYAGSYSFGTLELDMGDVKSTGGVQGEKIPLVWEAVGYGVLAGYYQGCQGGQDGAGIQWSRIEEAVGRAFDQSPYIRQ